MILNSNFDLSLNVLDEGNASINTGLGDVILKANEGNVLINSGNTVAISGETKLDVYGGEIKMHGESGVTLNSDQGMNIGSKDSMTFGVAESGNINLITNEGRILLNANENAVNIYGDQGVTINGGGDKTTIMGEFISVNSSIDLNFSSSEFMRFSSDYHDVTASDYFKVTAPQSTFSNNVAIDTPIVTNYKLAVGGKIVAEELKVALQGSTAWPDYVFTKDYNLTPLSEVEQHIQEKGHLENIPSAVQVQKEGGIHVGEMNIKLLEKIEELTLYTIAQDKVLKA